MEETERASIADDLRQGDILRLADGHEFFDFHLAAILNADCDMQNKKHDGVIAILPIYTFEQYLENFWLPIFLNEQLNEAKSFLLTVVQIEDQHFDDLLSWFRHDADGPINSGAAVVFAAYELLPRELAKAGDALNRIRCFIIAASIGTLQCLSCFAPTDLIKAKKFFRDKILNAKKQMGDGHFFITDIKGDEGIGFVVRMRRIYSIPADACFSSHAKLLASQASGPLAHRVCRLTPHYKFKMAQLFANQFSRIGLPDSVAALSDLAIDSLVSQIQSVD